MKLEVAFLIISIVFSQIIGFIFSDIWIIQQSLWILAVIIIFFKSIKNFEVKKIKIFLVISAIYLLLESLLKVWIANSYGGWLLINSLEHFIWSFVFSAIVYYPIVNIFKAHGYPIFTIFLISFVGFSGIIIELIEFLPRINTYSSNANYYPDTIRDLFINLLGAFFFTALNYLRIKLFLKTTKVNNLFEQTK